MERLRRLFSLFLASIFCGTCALAQVAMTQIQDTVYTPDDSLFSGTVTITWTGSATSAGSGPAPTNTSVAIYNGAFSVLLVPSTLVTPAACYQTVFNSSDGTVSWTETWQVPQSSAPLTLSEVEVDACGTSSTGSGGGGTTITISQVTGLTAALAAINSSITSLTNMLNTLTTDVNNISNSVATLTAEVNGLLSGAGGASPVFVDAELPGGIINGTNPSFTLANQPSPGSSLQLFRNGVLEANGDDYTLSGSGITFSAGSIPQAGDTLEAFYRTAGTGLPASIVDDEIPAGTIDGNNLNFNLSQAPNPASSLQLYKNGILLEQTSDYTLSGNQITFASTATTPQPGDVLLAFYRVTVPTSSSHLDTFPNRSPSAPVHQGR